METEDAFWDRRTTFWDVEEPARAPANAGGGPTSSRRSRRIRALSRRTKLASLCAFVSSAALIVVGLTGLVAGDVSHDRGHAAHASDSARAGSDARAPAPSPLEDALPLASVTDAPPAPATTAAAPSPGGRQGSQAPAAAGGGSGGTQASSTSGAAAPSSAPAPAPAGSLAPAPSPTPTTSPTTTVTQPSCTIGLLGTCVVGGGGVLP